MGGGLFTNVGPSSNIIVRTMGYISPIRYTTERLLRILLNTKPYLNYMCNYFDYTYEGWCLPIVALVAVVFFFSSGTTYLVKARFV